MQVKNLRGVVELNGIEPVKMAKCMDSSVFLETQSTTEIEGYNMITDLHVAQCGLVLVSMGLKVSTPEHLKEINCEIFYREYGTKTFYRVIDNEAFEESLNKRAETDRSAWGRIYYIRKELLKTVLTK